MGFVELLVILALIAILIFLALPTISCGPVSGVMTQRLSNMKQLHLATQQMALDAGANNNTNIGWPGDIGGSFSNWTGQLLDGNYLSRKDLCKLLSAPRMRVAMDDPFVTNNTAALVYAVSTNSPDDAVFLSSSNFTNTPSGGVLNPKDKSHDNKGFVVFRKAGDGTILQVRQAGQTNIIGSDVPLCH
jgi:type II secretory pathway pseudopilin PulG